MAWRPDLRAGARLVFVGGYCGDEARAAQRALARGDGAVVCARDPTHDREAQPRTGAVLAAPVEALEDALALLLGNALAVVVDDDFADSAVAP